MKLLVMYSSPLPCLKFDDDLLVGRNY